MKNFLRPLKLVCLAAASMLIVSCGSGADYRSILPADSFMTVSVNPASLMRKCEAGDLDQHPLYVRIKAELDKDQNLSAEEKEYLLALLKNPGESGIDVKKDFFFFAAMEGTVDAPVMRGGLLLPIGDKAKFDALLARINEKSGVAPETKGGVSVVDLGKEGDAGVLCAYNDIAFMVYFVQNGVDDLAGVKGDVLYCTTDAVVKMALDGGEIASMESMDKIFKGQSSTFYLDFEGLNAMIAQLLGGNVTPQAEAALSVLGMFDDMEAYGTMKGGTMIVNMVDKEQNSFKTICGKTGELIRQYVPEANL